MLSVIACKPDLNYELHGFDEKIIVEGRIAYNEYPKVYLSLNVPLWQELDSVVLMEKVIRTAKVTISDGEKSEILTSKWDTEHYPPYVYMGTSLKGETGKTYTIEITYSGYTVSASTTIPQNPEILGFEFTPSNISDSLKVLTANIKMTDMEQAYRIYSQKKQDNEFVETKVIYNENLNLKGNQQFLVNPAPNSELASFDEGGYFKTGDSILVKILSIDADATSFFKAFSVKSGVGADVDISQITQLNSNISEPGFGIWYGAGIKTYRLVVE